MKKLGSGQIEIQNTKGLMFFYTAVICFGGMQGSLAPSNLTLNYQKFFLVIK